MSAFQQGMSACAFLVAPVGSDVFYSHKAGHPNRCASSCRPRSRNFAAVRAQLKGPPSRKPSSEASDGDAEVSAGVVGSGDGTAANRPSDDMQTAGVENQGAQNATASTGLDGASASTLKAPVDATPLRSESEVRRNRPAQRQPRRRRRRGGDAEPVLEWDKMDTVPLVAGEDSVDGWVDLKDETKVARKRLESQRRLEESRDKVDDAMKVRLKSEVVQPYEQNWILWISAVIGLLAIAFKLSGGFDAIPVIQVPDL